MTNKCIKDLAIVGDTAHIKIVEIGTDKIIAEFDSPSFANTEERKRKMVDWTKTDFWKFTSEHQDVTIDVWGGWIGKNDGFEPWGWIVEHETLVYYFDLEGKLVKSKAM